MGKRRGTRQGLGKRWVAAIVSASFVTTTIVATPARIAEAALSDDELAAAEALVVAFATMAAADGLDELGDALPFTGITATGAEGLALVEVFTGLAMDVATELTDPDPTLAKIEDAIEGTRTVGGAEVVVEVRLSESSITFDELSITRDGITVPLGYLSGDPEDPATFSLEGGDLSIDLGLSFDGLTLERDGADFGIPTPAAPAQLTAAISLPNPDIATRLGILDVTASGSVTADLTFDVAWTDPDSSGSITQFELENSSPLDLLDVSIAENSDVAMNIALSSSLSGLGGVTGSIVLDHDLSDGELPAPTVDFGVGGQLGDFTNMTPQDVLAAIAQLATSLRSLQLVAGNPDLPLIDENLAEFGDWTDQLTKFFVDKKLASPENPLDLLIEPEEGVQCGDGADNDGDLIVDEGCPGQPSDLEAKGLASIEQIIAALEAGLALDPGDLGLAYVPATRSVDFTIAVESTFFQGSPGVEFNLADELAAAGISGVQLDASTSLTITPSYGINIGVGIDLSDAKADPNAFSLTDRVFIRPDADDPELFLDAPVTGNIEGNARIALLEVALADQAAGEIPVIDSGVADTPMLALEITESSGDGLITLTELFAGMSEVGLDANPDDALFTIEVPGAFTATGTANLSVEPVRLDVTGSIAGETLGTGWVQFEWPDVFTGQPSITSDATFNDNLLSFNIDPSNPDAMFTAILAAIEQALALVEDLAGEEIDQKIPILDTSLTDLLGWVDAVQDAVTALASDPSGNLELLEVTLEAAIAEALNEINPIPGLDLPPLPDPADPQYSPGGDFDLAAFQQDVESYIADLEAALGSLTDLVGFDYVPGNSPGALVLNLNLGVCSDTMVYTDCTWAFPVEQDFNLDTKVLGDDLAGIVDAQGQGTITLDYNLSANVDIGIELPTMTPDADADGLPDVASEFRVFVADTTRIDASVAGTLENAEFSASVGPFGVQVGETDAFAEEGDACAALNVDDDDEDGVINDGCPAVANFESGTQCENAVDDDGDGAVNDGCPEVAQGGSESGAQCSNDTDDDNDGDPDTADADGAVNDGCPTVEGTDDGEDQATQCGDNLDSDGDGEINDGCDATGNPMVAKAGAMFELANDGPTPNDMDHTIDEADRFYLTGPGPTIDEFFTGLEPDVGPVAGLNCDGGADVIACAKLPIYGTLELGDGTPTAYLGTIQMTLPDFDFDNATVTGTDDVLQGLKDAGEAFLFDLIAQGIAALGDAIEQGVSGAAYDVEVPIVGDVLDGGAEVAASFNQNVVQPAADLVASLNAASDFATVESTIRDFWWTTLGEDTADTLLLNWDDVGAPPVKAEDVVVTLLCGGSPEPCSTEDPPGTAKYTYADLADVSVEFAVGQQAAATTPDFDWGVPGLRLEGDGTLTGSVNWQVNVGFGVSLDEGFYLMGNPTVANGADNHAQVVASLDFGERDRDVIGDDADPPALNGDLAFLSAAVWNAKTGAPSDEPLNRADEVNLTLGIDFSGEDKIALPQFLSILDPTEWEVGLSGYIDFNATVASTAAVAGGAEEGVIPRLLADINLTWSLATTAQELFDDSARSSGFEFGFTNVRLDLGSFIAEFLKPVLGEVQRFTQPLQPIIDTLQAPIPGVSQLAELVGADPITLLDLMEAMSGADLTLIRRLLQVISFANSIPTNVSAGDESLIIDIGEFFLEPADLFKAELPSTSKSDLIASSTVAVGPDGILGQVGDAGDAGFAEQVALSEGEGGFSFPAFEEPTKLFNLLIGEDVELIEFDAGKLKAEVGWSQSFGPITVGPIPVSVVVSIGAAVEGRFVIGYDTKGIRQLVKNLTDDTTDNDDFFESVGTLFAGVYIGDLADDGSDPPEIRLTLEGSVGAAVDLVVIKAGIEAGLRATLDLNLHDGGFLNPIPPENLDGKLRIDEIITFINNPLCLFDVSGKLEAFIRIFVTLDLFLFSVTYKQTIVNITLLELNNITAELCQPPEPEPASPNGGDATILVLNVGDRAGLRNYDETETNEKIVVRQVSQRVGGLADMEVSYKGYTERYPGVSKVVGDGDGGDDKFIIEDGDISGTCRDDGIVDPAVPGYWSVGAPTDGISCLADGDDDDANPDNEVGDTVTFLVNFDTPLELCGGEGSDTIGGGDNADRLIGHGTLNAAEDGCDAGGPDDGAADDVDTITGEGGDDDIWGNDGPDILDGGSGNDEIWGGAEGDEIVGGIGADDGYGEAGNDNLSGGPEFDPCPDDDQDDCGDAPAARDRLWGGPGDDAMEGDHGDDEMHGEAGNDTMVGGKGEDEMHGGTEADALFGNEGDDDMFGDDGDDDLYGGTGDDDMAGGAHDDDLVGEEGIDTIDGDAGRDVILGDSGIVNRDPNADLGVSNFTASAGKLLVELEGSDVPPAAGDVLRGGPDPDRIWGQEGDDDIEGNGGDDLIEGNGGDDDIEGNGGDDDIFGNDGNDTIYGDAPPSAVAPLADGVDTVRGGNGDDVIEGNARGDNLFGDSGRDTIYGDADQESPDCATDGNDKIVAGSGDDLAFGNAGDDDIFGEGGVDRLVGGSNSADVCDGNDDVSGGQQADVIAGDNATIGDAPDPSFGVDRDHTAMLVTLYLDGDGAGDHDLDGDAGNDLIHGQVGDDVINGGDGNDYAEGNEGADTINGNAGDDDLIGGSSANVDLASGPGLAVHDDDRNGSGRLDGDDTISGDDLGQVGIDYVAGDNALISRNVPIPGRAEVELFDVETIGGPAVAAGTSAGDILSGGDEDDLMFGQGGPDQIDGDAGDDYIEGNHADDSIRGGSGDDDLVGGGSANDGVIDADRVGDTLADAGETLIDGGPGEDWITGDNALVDRNVPSDASAPIVLFDVESTTSGSLPGTGGGELLIDGGTGPDWIFGQTGDDTIDGGEGTDYVEGNNGVDAIRGGTENDDLVGGGSANDGVIDNDRVGDGLLDAGENVVEGNDGDDWITGDNALVNRNRPIVTGPTPPIDEVRAPIELFDVQTSTGPVIAGAVSGGDLLQGNDGDDRIFGQGNGFQPTGQTDPADGRNNDFNSAAEGAPDFDRFPSDLVAAVDEDGEHLAGWLGDTILGGADDDEIEGNHGNDLIYGDGGDVDPTNDGEDDIAGGGSADDGKIWDGMRLANGAHLLDGADIVHGDDAVAETGNHDAIVGDNGWVGRTGATISGDGPEGTPIVLSERLVTMIDAMPDAGTFGDDYVAGNGGHDEIYGQAGDDMLGGEYGSDALVGDLGRVTTELLGDGDANVLCGEPRFLEPQQPFVGEDVCVDGTLFRQVLLYAFDDTQPNVVEGEDVMLGGDGDDWMHGGAGSDLLQGDGDGGDEDVDPEADYTTDVADPNPASADKDRIFGGDSNGRGTVDPVLGGDGDATWGGRGDDYTWTGNGDDMIDVRPDGIYPATWAAWAEADVESYHGIDVSYGGWDQDAAQANVAANGPIAGDRLLDWAGVYNISYLCPATYGAYVTVRGQPPQLIQWVIDLAAASGAVEPGTPGSSGYSEVAMVYKPDVNSNTNPIYPGTPGHFSCSP